MFDSSKSERLAGLFNTHPKVDKFFCTSDGQAFFEKHHATAHAQTLEDSSVTQMGRAFFQQVQQAKADKFGENTANLLATSGNEPENGNSKAVSDTEESTENNSSETPAPVEAPAAPAPVATPETPVAPKKKGGSKKTTQPKTAE